MNAYLAAPPWARCAEKTIFVLVYVLIVINGFFFATLAPMGWLGWVVVISALSCVFGVITGRYRWEWVALSPLIAAMLIGVIIVNTAMLPYSIIFVVIVALKLVRRGIHLTLIARAIRSTGE